MTNNQSELESQVICSLEQMLTRYSQLDQLTQKMLAKHQQGQAIETEIEEMNQQRSELMLLEQESVLINDAYRNSREHASEAVKKLTEQTAVLIAGVIEAIAQLETAARQSYERLTPQINQNVKGNQMKQAYGNLGQ
jgi:hypothetical protein